MNEKIRIDKFISSQNLGSRKDVSIFLRKSLVTVNDIVVKNSSMKIDPSTDKVCLDGKLIEYSKFIYIMMNKPKGLLCATRDRAKTVLDIVPDELKRRELFPAGRLDKDTTGLLIITDDGEFAHKMLSPKSHVYKLYRAKLDTAITEDDIKAFANGIKVKEFDFLPCELIIDKSQENSAFVKIREGKFHQVKRMFGAVNKTVIELERLEIGMLKLDETLGQGECRKLSLDEIRLIFS